MADHIRRDVAGRERTHRSRGGSMEGKSLWDISRRCALVVWGPLALATATFAQATLPEVEVEAPRLTPGGSSPGFGQPTEMPGGPYALPGPAFMPPGGAFGAPGGGAFGPSGPPYPTPGPTLGGLGGGGGDGTGRGTIPWSSNAITTDSTRVGPYNQPAWTTQRPFAASRVYVLPPGTFQLEQWFRPTWPRDGKVEMRFLEELAIGLPCRFQLDLYERWNVEPNRRNKQEANHEGVQIELRWALADWGVIPLNPTLYAEWIERGNGRPDIYEFKLLLADEIRPNLFYASNVTFEQETGGGRAQEIDFSQAFSTPLIERKLLAGVEMLLQSVTESGSRGDPEVEFLIGPSVQWRPSNRTFLNVVPLFGTTKDSPIAQMFVIFGYQFGKRAGPSRGISGPVSTSGR